MDNTKESAGKGTDILAELFERIPGRYLICFATGMITGVIVHFFMLSNKITTHDDISSVPGVGGGAVLGRWLQEWVHDLFSPWSAPSVNGMMAIFFLAVAACLVVAALDMKSVTGAVLIPVIVMTFPAVAANMYFMYLAPTFGFAVLLSAAGVFITTRYRRGWIAGAVLQFLSMGIYQAYFAFAAALYVLILLLMLIDAKEVAAVVRKGLIFLLALALSMGAYLVSLRFVDLGDYKGLDSIGQSSAGAYLRAVARAYHRFLQYFITAPESYMRGAPTLINRLIIIISAILFIYLFIEKKLYKEVWRGVLSVILIVLLPFAVGLVYVMAPEVSHASTVMTFSYMVIYFALVAGTERLDGVCEGGFRRLSVCLAAVICALILCESYSQARVIGNVYYRSYIAQERVMEYYNRILTRIYDTDGYSYGDPILLAGGFYPDPMPVSNHGMNDYELEDFEGAAVEDFLFLPSVRERVLELWFGIDTGGVASRKDEIMGTEEFEEMPIYPDEGCVRLIDGIWVIKIGPDDK